MTEACAKASYIVGECWVLDDGQEPRRLECGLPAVPAAAGTAKFANAPLKHEPVPGPIDRASIFGGVQLKKLFPDTIEYGGVLWGNYPVIIDRRDQILEEAEHREATQQYLDIVEATGGDVNQMGEQAASAFLLPRRTPVPTSPRRAGCSWA